MSLSNTTSTKGFKAALLAPVLAVGLFASAPASAAGAGSIATIGDINSGAAANIIRVADRRGRGFRRGNRARGPVSRGRGYSYDRRRARRKNRRNLAIGLGVGILGAAIVANRHYKDRHYDNRPAYGPVYGYRGDGYRAAKRKCARVYGEDYSWKSDLVYDDYGDARVCKFVRRAGY